MSRLTGMNGESPTADATFSQILEMPTWLITRVCTPNHDATGLPVRHGASRGLLRSRWCLRVKAQPCLSRLPGSTATVDASTQGVEMIPRKFTKPFVIGGVTLIVAGGTYGIVDATSGGGSTTASAATSKVIPFDRGNPSPAKVVGQVPKGWTAGSGTLVTGTTANKAKAAAVAAYPGGTVNR